MESDSSSLVVRYISSIGTPVTSEEIDTYERLSLIEARSARGRGELRLRQAYGVTLLVLLSAQIVAVTTFMFLTGFGLIDVDRWVMTTFVGGTLGEVSGLAFVVVRHLFPLSGVQRQR